MPFGWGGVSRWLVEKIIGRQLTVQWSNAQRWMNGVCQRRQVALPLLSTPSLSHFFVHYALCDKLEPILLLVFIPSLLELLLLSSEHERKEKKDRSQAASTSTNDLLTCTYFSSLLLSSSLPCLACPSYSLSAMFITSFLFRVHFSLPSLALWIQAN